MRATFLLQWGIIYIVPLTTVINLHVFSGVELKRKYCIDKSYSQKAVIKKLKLDTKRRMCLIFNQTLYINDEWSVK